jgi:ribosome-associated translation inhibitor RaiA
MRQRTNQPGDSVRVSASPEFSSGATEYARIRIGDALEHASEVILSAHVHLTHHNDRAVALPFVAHANVDMNGRIIHAGATGASEHAAVDLLADRVRRQLDKGARHWEEMRGSVADRELRDLGRGHIDSNHTP